MDDPPSDLGVRVAARHLSQENGPQTEVGDHLGRKDVPAPRGKDALRKNALVHPGRTVGPDRVDPGSGLDSVGIRDAADRGAEDPGISVDDPHPPSRIASLRRA